MIWINAIQNSNEIDNEKGIATEVYFNEGNKNPGWTDRSRDATQA